MKKELTEFRKILKQEGIDLFIAKDADDHISEYCDPHFSAMKFLSGFTGGDGTLVITRDEAGLWTDGRYFIQAAAELDGSGITLRKEGEPDCPEMESWILDHIPSKGVLGFDGRCLSFNAVQKLLRKLSVRDMKLKCDEDPVGRIWKETRPEKRAEKIWKLDEKYAGRPAQQKLDELDRELLSKGAGAHVISAKDEIAWLLNLRGNDVPYHPVFDSFFLTDRGSRSLYVSPQHLTEEIICYLHSLNLRIIEETDRIYEDIGKIRSRTVLADGESCSYRLIRSLPPGTELINETGPVSLAKNRKNGVEAANLAEAQLKDSTAVVKFMYWFRKQLREGGELTETSTAQKLHQFRTEQEGFLGESFATISAYGANAAMCHYEPDADRPVRIGNCGLYLVDSGGHYPEGTTDITRTWACGPVTQEEKKAYTLTAAANLRLADQVFPEGTSGLTLDLAAREVFWKNGMDYNHGTGHGVGYLLYVHESPANIRFKASAGSVYGGMYEGVYVSDEPGFYAAGKFGVRLENMVLVTEAFENEFRRFMKFRIMTMVPFDSDCIDTEFMTADDIARYDRYHRMVYEAVSGRLNAEEKAWLEEMCRPLKDE